MRWIVAALVIGAAGCGERPSSADAARADSSAAGYAVGVRPETTTATATTTTTTLASGAPQGGDTSARGAKAPAATVIAAAPRKGAGAVTAMSSQDSAATSPRRAVADSTAGGARSAAPNGAPRAATGDSAPLPEGPVRVNEFLTYDRRTRTVSLQLVAGYNGLNGSLNYNGATNGSHGLYVPTGWRIHVAVTNRDSDLQHSAIVVQKVLPPPIEPTEPAFAAAALPRLDEGLNEDETGTLDFIADRPGQYMIACGVPGHAQAGMWLQLSVANGIKVPAYR